MRNFPLIRALKTKTGGEYDAMIGSSCTMLKCSVTCVVRGKVQPLATRTKLHNNKKLRHIIIISDGPKFTPLFLY